MIAIEVRPDHIHLFIEGISPIIRLSDVVKYLKGTSGLSLFRGFPKLRQKVPQRVDMVTELLHRDRGEVSSEVIKRYIEGVEYD